MSSEAWLGDRGVEKGQTMENDLHQGQTRSCMTRAGRTDVHRKEGLAPGPVSSPGDLVHHRDGVNPRTSSSQKTEPHSEAADLLPFSGLRSSDTFS